MVEVVIPDSDLKGLDADTIKKFLDTVVTVGEMLAKITPTTVDDTAVAFVKTVINQTWFMPVLTYVLSLLKQGKTEELKKFFDAFVK